MRALRVGCKATGENCSGGRGDIFTTPVQNSRRHVYMPCRTVVYIVYVEHMRSKGIDLLGLARTVRTVGGDGEHPDFRNLVGVCVCSSSSCCCCC